MISKEELFFGAEKMTRIPLMRIREKLDERTGVGDYEGAERLLSYWMEEARTFGDKRSEFALASERMGLFRKMDKKEEALESAGTALMLIEALGIEKTIAAGTAWLNAGTVYDCFGDPKRALDCFERARANYEENLPAEDERLGGLYNNMGLALTDAGRFEEALSCYRKALEVMERQPLGECERAITLLNMAGASEARLGAEGAEEEIGQYLEKAQELLSSPKIPRDGYYAFVLEKCAPTFAYYGWFLAAEEYKEEAAKIKNDLRKGVDRG